VTVGSLHPFVVHAASFRKVPGTTRHEARHGVIDGLGILGVSVPPGAELEVEVTLSSYPGGVMATGSVSAPWQAECRRCGGPVRGRVQADVRERFRFGGPGAAAGMSVGEDEDAYLIEDDLLDLEPLARDAVLLDLPLAPVCRTDCQGLCPQCGADLNRGACGCAPAADPRWSVLDALRDGSGDGLT